MWNCRADVVSVTSCSSYQVFTVASGCPAPPIRGGPDGVPAPYHLLPGRSHCAQEGIPKTRTYLETQEIADIIRAQLPERHQAPLGEPGKRLAHTHYSCDSSKAERVLGLKLKGLKESIVPLAEQLYDMAKL